MIHARPLVSVVVPIYNQERYLRRSVPAIMSQQYEHLEIILINDGSTDDSDNVLREFSAIDPRIKIVEKANGGLVDATIAGIKESTGDYIAFVDPDDYVGSDYILNFVSALDTKTDIVAAGFFYDNRHILRAVPLREDRTYQGADLQYLRNHILKSPQGSNISDCLFVSRWNKLYRLSCVKRMIGEFSDCKQISLGEDSLFTYLVLRECTSVKTLELVNSYYYNINSSSSMMGNTDVLKHLSKAEIARKRLEELLKEDNNPTIQADYLYYFLVNALLGRLATTSQSLFIHAYGSIRNNPAYSRAVSALLEQAESARERVMMKIRKYLSPALYYFATFVLRGWATQTRDSVSDVNPAIRMFRGKGLQAMRRTIKFRRSRRTALEDLTAMLPVIEQQILPMLKPFIGKTTNFDECPIAHKVFVFWWDGFEHAPDIVKSCLESVKNTHADDELILLSKNNYEQYTDIVPELRQGYERGDISVQTFSDILRFNVLKNNGGTWVDATLYFNGPVDLTEGLAEKSFESLNCNTTPDYMEYQGLHSTWTGFFIASRRNAVITQAIDSVFREYFIQYHQYPIYLFIDAVFMICLKQGIDGNVLSNIQTNTGYLFEMLSLLDEPQHSEYTKRWASIPQKLNWFHSTEHPTVGSVIDYVLQESSADHIEEKA